MKYLIVLILICLFGVKWERTENEGRWGVKCNFHCLVGKNKERKENG